MKHLTQAEYDALTGGLPMDAAGVEAAAHLLVGRAAILGLVLTVEQQPRQPLAMGNHQTVVTVREARKCGA